MQKQREAFEQSLLREDVVKYYLSKTNDELEMELGNAVSRMVGYEQKNAHHCYDLWEHTLHTIEFINTTGLDETQIRKLKVAAFFHDIGKPDVSKFNEKTGQQVFYDHAKKSVEIAKPILEKLGYNNQEIEQLVFFIGHHDDFISYKTRIAPFMRNHEFIREINKYTVAEKMIENKFDFEAMGYDKDQIRYICYSLAHNKKPDFRTKNGPIIIDVNMDEVNEKMASGNYNFSYNVSVEDYIMLLRLCKADNFAQSEVAMINGRVQGTKKEKIENLTNVENSIKDAYSLAEKCGYKKYAEHIS